MKSKTPLQSTAQATAGIFARNVDKDLPISSAIVGVTLLGDLEDVLAVARTAVLLARSMKATLSLNLFEKNILSDESSETPYPTLVSKLLDSVRTQLCGLNVTAFAVEVNVVAASFVCVGSLTMSVHSVSPVPGPKRT
jgi:hypothetical protein